MNIFVFWTIPPLIGAFIGYITNAIAIKMLFRPLGEKRIFGIRVPFTPGVLPRERHKLADSIGRMVERELLTPEIVRERLAHQQVKEQVQKSLSEYTAKFLSLPPSLWNGAVSGIVLTGAEAIYPKAADMVVDFLKRRDIRLVLETQGRLFLSQAILKLNVFQRFFVSAAQYDRTLEEKMPEIIEDLLVRLDELLMSPETEAKILSILEEEIRRFPEKRPDYTLEKIFSLKQEEKEKLDGFLASRILATADEQIEAILTTVNIRSLVSERIDSLDMIKVERIVLDVMAGQLKWINVFGAILGALIGFVQIAVSLVL
ncbi:MAG: DUF445 family protein [Treponema sp.]|jgi:uncharacterized membrane protein YheB (UPF0754 family)|nr:DUF445 family protein [Treponema sp.]